MASENSFLPSRDFYLAVSYRAKVIKVEQKIPTEEVEGAVTPLCVEAQPIL